MRASFLLLALAVLLVDARKGTYKMSKDMKAKMKVMGMFAETLNKAMDGDEDGHPDPEKAQAVANFVIGAVRDMPEEPPFVTTLRDAGVDLKANSRVGQLSDDTTLKQCITGYKKGMEETFKWMMTAMGAGMKCKFDSECHAIVKGRIDAMGPAEQAQMAEACGGDMKNMKAKMFAKLLVGLKKGEDMCMKLHVASEMAADSCSPNKNAGVNGMDMLSRLIGGSPVKMVVTGHMCKIATLMEMMAPEVSECHCNCWIREMEAAGMGLEPEKVQQKLAFFSAIASGADPDVPAVIAQHDPTIAASCFFEHCDQKQIAAALHTSGLADIIKEKRKMESMMRKKAPQMCSCLKSIMPDAPIHSDDEACEEIGNQMKDEGMCQERIQKFLGKLAEKLGA